MDAVDVDLAQAENWPKFVDHRIAQLEAGLVQIRRYLHTNPEPSNAETKTSRFIWEKLQDAGINARVGSGDIGVVADLQVGEPAADCPLIALRADIDALQLTDGKDVEYASQNQGITHACGHDAHTAIVLGAARAAADLSKAANAAAAPVGARLRFLFQPAEEVSTGARNLVAQGCIEGVDAILGLHVDPERPAGQIGLKNGVLTAHCDDVRFTIHGKGGHAARPHHSVDPIAAATQLLNALYQFVPRSVDSRDPAVLTIGMISGGYAPNVIPDHVDLAGTMRTIRDETRTQVKKRIREIAHGVSETTGVSIDVRIENPLNSVVNDPRINLVIERVADEVLGPGNVNWIELPSMGAEDFGVYQEHAPGVLVRLGCAAPGKPSHFLHSPLFDIDERILALGAKILLRTALVLSEGSALRSKPEA